MNRWSYTSNSRYLRKPIPKPKKRIKKSTNYQKEKISKHNTPLPDLYTNEIITKTEINAKIRELLAKSKNDASGGTPLNYLENSSHSCGERPSPSPMQKYSAGPENKLQQIIEKQKRSNLYK